MGSAPSIPSFQAPSGAPSFAWTNPSDIQNAAIAGDMQSYNLSDQDFAARYPGLVSSNQVMGNNANANMQGMSGVIPQAAGNLKQFGNALPGMAAYLQVGGTTALRNAKIGLNAGAQDISQGQGLIQGNQPLNPLIQQQMMTAGLQGAAGSLGSGNLAQGAAGQAAVARNLGLNVQQYIQGQQTMGENLQNTGANLQGQAANLTNTASNAYGSLGNLYNGYINNVASLNGQVNQGNAIANSINQPRTFGIGGQGVGNVLTNDMSSANNMAAFLYGSKVQGAQLNTQIAGENANASAQAGGQMAGAGVSVATTAATVAAIAA